MSYKFFQASTLFLCLLSVLHSAAVAADEISEQRSISVSGLGEAAGSPDRATVTAGVVTRAATVIDASKENQAAVERVMQALAKLNIESKDIQTADYGIWPEQRHDPRNSDEPVISGYRVNNLLRINIKDVARLSTLLAAVTDAGANSIQGISFGVEDPSALEASARAAAMADARQKAEAEARQQAKQEERRRAEEAAALPSAVRPALNMITARPLWTISSATSRKRRPSGSWSTRKRFPALSGLRPAKPEAATSW